MPGELQAEEADDARQSLAVDQCASVEIVEQRSGLDIGPTKRRLASRPSQRLLDALHPGDG
jgi:hypothetical protein